MSRFDAHPKEWSNDPRTHELLSAELRATGRLLIQEIRARHFPTSFSRLLLQALRRPGKLLSKPLMQGHLIAEEERWLWPLLALLSAACAASAQTSTLSTLPRAFWQRARSCAASVELLFAAADIFDDIQDSDNPYVERLGVPKAMSVGLSFLQLAHLLLGRTHCTGWTSDTAQAASDLVHNQLLASLGGQFLDLHFEHIHTITEAQVLEMTGRKSGALLSLVCRLGALAGVETVQPKQPRYFEALGQFGWHLGVWRQLLNDLDDAQPVPVSAAKSDRQRKKKTLPLLLEQQGLLGTRPQARQQPLPSADSALAYTAVAAETFRLRAERLLQTIEQDFGPHSLLWPFLAVQEEAPASANKN